MISADDARWLDAAARLAARGSPEARPNPAVGAIIVQQGRLIARGWTRAGGRPHAEAEALAAAGSDAKGAVLYVSLEPCAHRSARGPACADLVAASGVARVVIGCADPDPRTAGQGMARLRAAGIVVELIDSPACAAAHAGYLTRSRLGRPHITLKLALSLDGCIARADGESQWITGEAARAHVHAQRARMDAILVGGGTLRADQPRLDVRLPGLESRSPQRWVLTSGAVPAGWHALRRLEDITMLAPAQTLMVEGGAQTASAFLAADLVDRLMIYRAPIVIGNGLRALEDIGLTRLADAHDRWQLADQRQLGNDTFEVYEKNPCSQA